MNKSEQKSKQFWKLFLSKPNEWKKEWAKQQIYFFFFAYFSSHWKILTKKVSEKYQNCTHSIIIFFAHFSSFTAKEVSRRKFSRKFQNVLLLMSILVPS
jgi:hypothetical protein